MALTYEQRVQNMAKAREAKAARAAAAAHEVAASAPEPSPEPQEDSQRKDSPRREQPEREIPRLAEMEELAQARDQQMQEVGNEPAPAEPVSPELAQPAQTAAADTAPAPAPKMVKVKVDGVESEVSEEEVEAVGGVRAYQTAKAAEHRLERANQALAETRRTQAQIAQWAQQQLQARPAQPQPSEADLLEAVRTGTPEQAQAAWATLKQGMAVDPATIENRAIFKTNQRLAAEHFRSEFQDVMANPHLATLAALYENQRLPVAMQSVGIQAWNDPRIAAFDFSTFYRNIGNELRSALPRPSQPQQAPVVPAATPASSGNPSQSQTDREARKASIVNLPAAAAARAEAPAEEKPETREQILNSMRKSRGQLTM